MKYTHNFLPLLILQNLFLIVNHTLLLLTLIHLILAQKFLRIVFVFITKTFQIPLINFQKPSLLLALLQLSLQFPILILLQGQALAGELKLLRQMLALLRLNRRLVDQLIVLEFDLLELVGDLHEDALVFTLDLRILLFLLLEFLLTRLDLSPQSAVLLVYFTVDLLIALLHLGSLVLEALLQLTGLLLQFGVHVLALLLQLPNLFD